MHLTKTFVFTAFLSTLGLGTPTRQHGSRDTYETSKIDHENDGIDESFRRDVQAANMVLIKDLVATTGWDMKTREDLTQERIAKLAPADALLLSGEMNKYLRTHGRRDVLIPDFTQEDFESKQAPAGKDVFHPLLHALPLRLRAR